MMKKQDKSTLQELATHLGVALSTVKAYEKKKKLLMLVGLKQITISPLSYEKASLSDLAIYLHKSYSTVAKYPKGKRDLMLAGLFLLPLFNSKIRP